MQLRHRRIFTAAVICGAFLWLAYLWLPWDANRYLDDRLLGRTPQQVTQRLGPPYYDSRQGGDNDEKFSFGYVGRGGLLGSTYRIDFEKGRVVKLNDLGMK